MLSAYAALEEADVVHDHTVAGPLCATSPGNPGGHHQSRSLQCRPQSNLCEMSCQGVAVVAISHHQASTAQNVKIAAVIHHGIDIDNIPIGDGDGGTRAPSAG